MHPKHLPQIEPATEVVLSPTVSPQEVPLSVREAAVYVGVSSQTIYLWVERKRIPHLWVMGRNIRFLKPDLEQFRADPTTASATEVEKEAPSGNAPLVRQDPTRLQPPDSGSHSTTSAQSGVPCGFDPRTEQPFRFNPETRQPCTSQQDRVVVRQPAYSRAQTSAAPAEPTPEERRITAAYQRQEEAMIAPTGIRSSGAGGLTFPGAGGPASTSDDPSDVTALTRAIAGRNPSDSGAPSLAALASGGSRSDSDYDAQNMLTTKAASVAAAWQRKTDDYLRSLRTPPLSVYEIKAGWEIPAVLEQSLNPDVPVDIKALISSNVFDSATGANTRIARTLEL